MTSSLRNRVLLAGEPGNGKTTLAEALAHALMVPFVVARYDGLIASYLGETASRLKKAVRICADSGMRALLRRVRHDREGARRSARDGRNQAGRKLTASPDRRAAQPRRCRNGYQPSRTPRSCGLAAIPTPARTPRPTNKEIEEYFAECGVSPEIFSGSLAEKPGRKASRGQLFRAGGLRFRCLATIRPFVARTPTSRRSCNSGSLSGRSGSESSRRADRRDEVDFDGRAPFALLPEGRDRTPSRRGGGGFPSRPRAPPSKRLGWTTKFQALPKASATCRHPYKGWSRSRSLSSKRSVNRSRVSPRRRHRSGHGMACGDGHRRCRSGRRVEDDGKADKKLARRLYAVMSNQQAMNQVLALWGSWCANPGERAKRNFGPFKTCSFISRTYGGGTSRTAWPKPGWSNTGRKTSATSAVNIGSRWSSGAAEMKPSRRLRLRKPEKARSLRRADSACPRRSSPDSLPWRPRRTAGCPDPRDDRRRSSTRATRNCSVART